VIFDSGAAIEVDLGLVGLVGRPIGGQVEAGVLDLREQLGALEGDHAEESRGVEARARGPVDRRLHLFFGLRRETEHERAVHHHALLGDEVDDALDLVDLEALASPSGCAGSRTRAATMQRYMPACLSSTTSSTPEDVAAEAVGERQRELVAAFDDAARDRLRALRLEVEDVVHEDELFDAVLRDEQIDLIPGEWTCVNWVRARSTTLRNGSARCGRRTRGVLFTGVTLRSNGRRKPNP
jgi:hypothetical protein